MDSLETLLAPISPESPCGPDISWEHLAEIRSTVRPKVDRKTEETSGGKRMVEVIEEPNWNKVLALCEAALRRSRHLEICVVYATARLQLHGLEGMAEGITLISRLVRQYWDSFHPVLEADDRFDPARRIGMIENLSLVGAIPEDDPLRFVERLRQAPLCHLPQVGIINLLTLQGAKPGSDAPAARMVREAVADAMHTSPGEQKKNAAAADTALDELREMNTFLATTKELERLPVLDRLERQLEAIREVYQMSENSGTVLPEAPILPDQPSSAPTRGVEPAVAATGEIRCSADVLRSIDKICEYYKRAEPSSPVPLILARARRLVDQSFMDVLGDLASSAVDQVKVITGQQ